MYKGWCGETFRPALENFVKRGYNLLRPIIFQEGIKTKDLVEYCEDEVEEFIKNFRMSCLNLRFEVLDIL